MRHLSFLIAACAPTMDTRPWGEGPDGVAEETGEVDDTGGDLEPHAPALYPAAVVHSPLTPSSPIVSVMPPVAETGRTTCS